MTDEYDPEYWDEELEEIRDEYPRGSVVRVTPRRDRDDDGPYRAVVEGYHIQTQYDHHETGEPVRDPEDLGVRVCVHTDPADYPGVSNPDHPRLGHRGPAICRGATTEPDNLTHTGDTLDEEDDTSE